MCLVEGYHAIVTAPRCGDTIQPTDAEVESKIRLPSIQSRTEYTFERVHDIYLSNDKIPSIYQLIRYDILWNLNCVHSTPQQSRRVLIRTGTHNRAYGSITHDSIICWKTLMRCLSKPPAVALRFGNHWNSDTKLMVFMFSKSIHLRSSLPLQADMDQLLTQNVQFCPERLQEGEGSGLGLYSKFSILPV